jgi:FixJ family two-component response regulator
MDAFKNILLLDDDESMLRSLERGLRVRGYETEAYRCVTEFLGRARFEKSRCLLLDIDLKGQSGIDVACKLRQMGHSLPIIFMTGSDSEATRRDAIQTGCAAYLKKPFAFESLLQAIEEADA